MRPASWLLIILQLVLASCSAARLSRNEAQRTIAELGTSRLIPEAVEIRKVDSPSQNFAVVDSTVTLAFLFQRDRIDHQWRVGAIRFGDRDWINMSEVLAAISGGAGTKAPAGSDPVTHAVEVANELRELLPSARDISELTEERERMTEIGQSRFVPNAITIRRIIRESANDAVAESTVTLSFQFKRNGQGGTWYITGVRLGQRDWIDVTQLLAALNEGRRRDTIAAVNKVVAGIEAYRTAHGAIPAAKTITALTDVLHPNYMNELVRLDAWGRPLNYSVNGATYRVASNGPDGIPGTVDDIVVLGSTDRAP